MPPALFTPILLANHMAPLTRPAGTPIGYNDAVKQARQSLAVTFG